VQAKKNGWSLLVNFIFCVLWERILAEINQKGRSTPLSHFEVFLESDDLRGAQLMELERDRVVLQLKGDPSMRVSAPLLSVSPEILLLFKGGRVHVFQMKPEEVVPTIDKPEEQGRLWHEACEHIFQVYIVKSAIARMKLTRAQWPAFIQKAINDGCDHEVFTL